MSEKIILDFSQPNVDVQTKPWTLGIVDLQNNATEERKSYKIKANSSLSS